MGTLSVRGGGSDGNPDVKESSDGYPDVKWASDWDPDVRWDYEGHTDLGGAPLMGTLMYRGTYSSIKLSFLSSEYF